MNHWTCRILPVIALHTALAGCQNGPAEGEYVTFVREIMAESALLDEAAGEGPDRSEEVEEAVRAWKGGEEED